MKITRSIILIKLVLMITSLNSKIMAQNKKKYTELKTISTSDTIKISSAAIWDIIKNPDISTWSTLLDSTEYFGPKVFEGITWSKRVSIVNSKGHHKSYEDLIAYEPNHRIIKFASTKLPKFIISNETYWEVIDGGPDQSVVKITTLMYMKKFHAFFLKRPMLKAIQKNSDGIFYDIKFYAENNAQSPKKKKRIKKLQKMKLKQKKTYKIVKETLISDIINVSADSLWAICREFDKTAEWTSTLNHSYGSGEPEFEGASCSSRTCETNIGKSKKVVEELILFSDEKKELAYNLTEGAPGFIPLASNHWKVVEIGPYQSKIVMKVTMHMKRFAGFFLNKLITKQMKKQVNIVQKELKIYAETGKVSEAKKRQIKKNKKDEQ